MQVEVSPAEDSKARLSVTLSPEEVATAVDATYQRIAQRVRVPGFRPGKAPRQLLLRTYGDEAFYHQATDEAVRRWYPKALAQSGVEPIDQGELDFDDEHDHIHPGEPFSFAAIVTVKPEFELPDYAHIKIPAPSTAVQDADVDRVVESIRLSRATLEPAPAKEAAIGDVVKMNVHGRSEGKEVFAQEDATFELVEESEESHPRFPGLSEQLVGSRPGDIREIVLSLPQDYQDQALAGHSLSLQIVVKEIQRKVLPELTDELAASVSRATSVAALRDMIRRNLEQEKWQEAREKVSKEIIDSLIARTNLTAPDVLVSAEQDRMLRTQKRYLDGQGVQFERFLMATRKDESEYRDELRPAAERAVKRDLILDAVARAEEIDADPGTVDAKLREMSQAVARSERDLEQLAHSERLRETVSEEMRRELALNRLVELTSGLKPYPDHGHDDGGEAGPAAETEPDAVAALSSEAV